MKFPIYADLKALVDALINPDPEAETPGPGHTGGRRGPLPKYDDSHNTGGIREEDPED